MFRMTKALVRPSEPNCNVSPARPVCRNVIVPRSARHRCPGVRRLRQGGQIRLLVPLLAVWGLAAAIEASALRAANPQVFVQPTDRSQASTDPAAASAP